MTVAGQITRTEMCGGCGNYDPAQRCIGCLHDFAPAAKPVPEHISDERLAEMLAQLGDDTFSGYPRSKGFKVADLRALLTELQHRREAEAETREALIKRMVDRFLGWKLPDDFSPDGGISFEKAGNAGTTHEYTREPMGTNLLDAVQATAMVRYMLNGGDGPSLQPAIDRLIEIEKTTGVAPMAASPSSPASGARVKALEWSEVTSPRLDGPPEPTGDWEGSGVTGIYSAYVIDGYFEVTRPDDSYVEQYLAGVDEAKAAAQSDYEALIRSALGEHP